MPAVADAGRGKGICNDGEVELIQAKLAEIERDLPLEKRWMSTSLTIALHHGCRLRETQIPFTRIDFRAGTIRFVAKGRSGGEPHVFTVQIHPGLVDLLTRIKATGAEYTCVLPRLPSKAWWSLFQGDPRLKHLCFHCTRVTVITRLARAGVPISTAMRYVGHSSEAVHRIYQKLRADDLGVCHSALAGIAPAPQTQGGQRSTP